ncbi:MAG TPA: ABC transporter ATP-binding protein [Anaerolineaceae bacterium]|nr:ABC transporter ATP-binding protein [Anaerolineaceae bacterium]HPN53750.1 ABC transporter ATP-binding protein [Anaerolineaceae bacterium]
MIQVSALRKTYRMGTTLVHALDGVDLTVERNTFSVLLGPSGSGKSTLLYLLGGLDRPTSGKITINRTNLDTLDENALALYRRKTVGFIFQSFNLIPTMNALENVAFPMSFVGIPSGQRKKKAYELLKVVGLEKRALHKPTELSGGQQQRVAIARALVNDPPLILADEPTGNLDTASGHLVLQILTELHQSGRTVLVVTHDERMVRYATNVVRLLDGRIVDHDITNFDDAAVPAAQESR